MARQQFIDKMYHIVKDEYENKAFAFHDIWKKIVKEDKLSKDEQKTNIGVVYTDLLQDARFVYMGNKKWMLREYATQEEIAKYQNALYDFAPEVIEEGYVVPAPAVDATEEVIKESVESEETEEDLDVKTSLEKSKTDDEEE